MKGKIKQIEEKNFEPFVLELTIESAEEARLLWHVFNRVYICDVIFSEHYGEDWKYNNNILADLSANEVIRDEIEQQLKKYNLSIYS